jgi:hypothetical protein
VEHPAAGRRFPFDMPDSSPTLLQALRAGLADVRRSPVLHPVAFLLFAALYVVGLLAPWASLVFILAVAFPLAGGYVGLALGLARGAAVDLRTLFTGFRSMEAWIGVGFLSYLGLILACMPFFVSIVVAQDVVSGAASPVALALGAACSVVLLLRLLATYALAFCVVADDGAGRSMSLVFRRAAQLSGKARGRNLAALLGAGLLAASGLAAGGIGVAFTGPWAAASFTQWYRARAALHPDWPAPDTERRSVGPPQSQRPLRNTAGLARRRPAARRRGG